VEKTWISVTIVGLNYAASDMHIIISFIWKYI
jgi:hypothetical protein